MLGLIAEQVSDVLRINQEQIAFPSLKLESAPFLGAMIQTDRNTQSLAQLIEVDRVLPPALRDALFGGWEKTDEETEASASSERGIEVTDPDDLLSRSRTKTGLGVGMR